MTRKLWIAAILLWTLVVTILRAVRLPNDFAEAHWLLDYRFGFVKRGVVGSVVSLLASGMHMRPTEQLIALFSGTAFVLYCLVLAALGLRALQRSGWSTGTVLALLAFCSSPFIVMSAHLVGYFDNLIIMLAVLSIALLLNGRIWVAAAVQAMSIFIHESSLLIGFPVFCFAWLLARRRENEAHGAVLPFRPLLLPIGAFVVLVVGQSLFLPRDFEQSFATHLSHFPFIQQHRTTLVPKLLAKRFSEYYSRQGGKLLGRISSLAMYRLILPSMFAIIYFTVDAFRIHELSVESVALLVVCLAPQLLHMMASDTPRIWTYSILSSFLVLWVYTEVRVPRPDVCAAVRLVCLVALALNIISMTPLMDGESDHFTLATRLLLYAPAMGATVALILWGDAVPIKERLSIRPRG